ncbi:hypothetical protein AB0D46_30905 [Streptomyces sp. NPDC048383]|uniref:hypothetical protein n=1 Tax=Streptomyces sp. NPDC048383 TaxID=3155386 RepID=UPI0034477938
MTAVHPGLGRGALPTSEWDDKKDPKPPRSPPSTGRLYPTTTGQQARSSWRGLVIARQAHLRARH